MSEDKKTNTNKENKVEENKVAQTVATDVYGADTQKKGNRTFGNRPGGAKRGSRRDDRPKEEFEQRILDIARVTRVMAGGKRMNFRACVAIGDKKGNVAVGLGKGADVTIAVNKAVNKAKKIMIKVPMVKETIPHAVTCKLGAARIIFKPASKGKGIISGGVVRTILELAGVKNVTTKTIGTNNKVNNARCTIKALDSLRKVDNDNNKKLKDGVKTGKELKTETAK
ncbi:30S ribosomal protein S5 [Patescibacteria group bacterium]|nr:30S ribosomal protein S5 [Patescibacteria group bacterium]